MLHTKFHGSASRFRRRRFVRVSTINGHGGQLGHVTQMPRTNFRSPYPRRIHIKFCFDRSSGFGGEDVRNCKRMDGRRTDAGAWVSYKLTFEPSAQLS